MPLLEAGTWDRAIVSSNAVILLRGMDYACNNAIGFGKGFGEFQAGQHKRAPLPAFARPLSARSDLFRQFLRLEIEARHSWDTSPILQ